MDIVLLENYLRKILKGCFVSTLSLGFTLSLSSGAHAQSALPKYTSFSAPSPSPGAPGESFNPSMTVTTPAANTPLSAEWTRTAGPDESMVITGTGFTRYQGVDEGKDSRFAVYSSKGFSKDASIQRLESNKVVITLDKDIPEWSMYLIWPGNDAGYGQPIAVNKTDVWWVGPSKATRGNKVSVYGRNLSHNNDSLSSNVYIKSASGGGQWVSLTGVNPYKLDFIVPSNLANGDYEIWAHNGHGGEYGWSGPLKLTINDGVKWTQTIFNVKNYGALGNGVNDDTDAIKRAIAAARYSAGSTVYFPAGTYMISNMLVPDHNTQWKGDGSDKTSIKCNSNFTSTDAMILGRINNFQVSDITFDTNNNYRGGHAEPIFFRGSTNVRFNNVVMSCQGYNILQLDNTSEIFITNCKIIGKISFLGQASQLYIDRCKFYLTNDTENALHSWGGANISITNSTCQDYDNSDPNNGAGWGKGRFFCATGNFGSTRNTYIGHNSTYDLTVRQSADVDQNSGEQFLWEGFAASWSGTATSSSASSTTLNGYSKTPIPYKEVAVITKGKGLGQSRRIISSSGSTINLESPWNVLPDATSTIAVGNFADRIVMYKNSIDGKEYAVTSPNHTASAGIEPYGGVLNFIADRNTISEVRMAIANFSTQHTTGIDPNYFSLYTNNKITGCRWGIQNGLDMNRPAEIALFATTFRKNTVSNTLQSGIVNTVMTSATSVLEHFIYEHNEFSNVRSGFSTGGDSGLPNGFPSAGAGITAQTFYKNNFSSSANLDGIKVTPKITLRDNTFSGFAASYSGVLTEPVVKSPIHVSEITGAKGSITTAPFTVWNSGISSINWTASSNTDWLTLSDSAGVITNERASSSISLKADASSLSIGRHAANIEMTVGTVIKKYTVIFNVTASDAPQVSISSPAGGSSYTSPATITINAEASDPDGAISRVEFFSDSTKLGEDVTSPYSFIWTNAAAGTYALTVKATDNAALTTISTPVEIKVSNPIIPLAPVIFLTSPASKTNFTSPASVIITAEATDADGTISKVEYFADTTKLGESLTSPYTFEWKDVQAGAYSITAKATDNAGTSTSSAAVEINVVTAAIPFAPVVELTSPAANSSFTAPAATVITATASDADGSISKVEFFSGTSKLGEDLSSPYTFNWNNISAGSYAVTVKATDNSGLTATSSPINIVVSAQSASCAGTGSIRWEYWTNIAGNTVDLIPLTVQSSGVKYLTSFASPVSFGEYYGSRARGYICPPVTGDYVFYIASDDHSELWLSNSDNPSGKIKIASVSDWTNPEQYDRFPSQQSATISLEAGQRYYIEALQKDGNGSDHLSVGWKLPDGTLQRPIAGMHLIPFEPVTEVIQIAPVVAVTAPVTNSSFTSPASITITSSASDTDGTVTKVEFFAGATKLGEDLTSPFSFTWNNASAGNYTITAKATDNSGLTGTSSPVNIVVNAPLAPTVSITALLANSSFSAPASIIISAVAADTDGSISKVEFFADNIKLGEDITSPYSFTWNNVTAGNYSITAKATDNSNLSGISAAKQISVNPAIIPAAPVITLTSPSANSNFTSPASVVINANASDTDGTINKVEFYAGTTKLGEDLTSPYSFTWENVAAGIYTITAKAIDNSALTNTTSGVTITVTAPVETVEPIAPLISITSPVSGYTAIAPATLSIAAHATDPDGTIVKVEFFEGTTKLGEDLSSPYTITWNNIAAGNHTITAKATDNSGLVSTSSAVTVTISNPSAPVVAITSPARNSTITAPASTTITASASDQDGTIAKVEFFSGATKLGEDLSSPYNLPWNDIAAGTYTITAKATDNSGLTTTSAPMTIVVTAPLISIDYNLTSYPNPFQSYANIEFTGIEKENAVLQVFNLSGVLLETLYRGKVEAGQTYSFKFDGSRLPDGTYLLRLVCGKKAFSRLLLLSR